MDSVLVGQAFYDGSWGRQDRVALELSLLPARGRPACGSRVSAASHRQPVSYWSSRLWATPALLLPFRLTIGAPSPRDPLNHSFGLTSPGHWLLTEIPAPLSPKQQLVLVYQFYPNARRFRVFLIKQETRECTRNKGEWWEQMVTMESKIIKCELHLLIIPLLS